MEKQILIAAPSELEFNLYLPYLKNAQILSNSPKAYKGLIGKNNIVLAQIGIGKINAALNTCQLLNQISIKQIFLVGVAGICPQAGQVGDIYLADYVFNSDLGYLFDGLQRESLKIEVSNMLIKSDDKLIKNFQKFNFSESILPLEVQIYNQLYGKYRQNSKVIKGVCASGDCFFQGFEATNWPTQLAYQLTQANYSFTEMEAASVLQVAQSFNIPALVSKIASNYDRPWKKNISSQESLNMGLKLIPQIASLQAQIMAEYFEKPLQIDDNELD